MLNFPSRILVSQFWVEGGTLDQGVAGVGGGVPGVTSVGVIVICVVPVVVTGVAGIAGFEVTGAVVRAHNFYLMLLVCSTVFLSDIKLKESEQCNNNFIFFYAWAFSTKRASQQFFERISVPSFVHTGEPTPPPHKNYCTFVPLSFFCTYGKRSLPAKNYRTDTSQFTLCFVGISSNCQHFICL